MRNVQYRPFHQDEAFPNGLNRNHPYIPSASNTNHRNTRQELTPYDLFSKPELPTQYLMSQQQNQAQSAMNSGGANESNPLNFDSVISKVGQLASTYHQVSPIVKQFSTFVKGFM